MLNSILTNVFCFTMYGGKIRKEEVVVFNKLLCIVVLMIFVISISGCAIYRRGILPEYNMSNFPEQPIIQKDVSLGVVFFDRSQSRKLFDAEMLKRGVQPVLILINNQSRTAYYFKKELINPSFISAEVVAKKCARKTMAKQLASLPLLILPPLGIAMMISNGILGSTSNSRMEKDYMLKEIENSVVRPDSSLSGVIFMPVLSQEDKLTITLVAENTKRELVFELQNP